MEFVAIIVPLFLLAIGGAVVLIGRKNRLIRRQVTRRNAPLPPLVVPTSAGASDIVPAGVIRETAPAIEHEVEYEVEHVMAEPAQAEAEQRLETWGGRSRSRSTPGAHERGAARKLRTS